MVTPEQEVALKDLMRSVLHLRNPYLNAEITKLVLALKEDNPAIWEHIHKVNQPIWQYFKDAERN